jgi:ribonucleoside-diphosphate reductase alpha chain
MRVVKRNGDAQEVDLNKITHRLRAISQCLDRIDVVIVAKAVVQGIYDMVTTEQLDELSIEVADSMTTTDPQYADLAARLAISVMHKRTPNSFSVYVSGVEEQLSEALVKVVAANKERLDAAIDTELDQMYSLFGLRTLQKSYLLKGERPGYMLMRVALGIHGEDVDTVIECYGDMAKHLYTHATPTLFNAGLRHPQMASCFLLSMEDSVKGIYKTLTDTALISQHAGGIGLSVSDIRAKGSAIKGTGGTSNGLVPMLRVFNASSRFVDQGGGRRPGSIAVYLECWHADILDFLDLRKNTGNESARCRDLFTALWVSDLFMERVKANAAWTLFSPSDVPGLTTCHSVECETLYLHYEAQANIRKQSIPAQKLWKAILASQMETGTPYICFKDACNRKSNQKNLGTIKCSNLCVAPETTILTSTGHHAISYLVDQEVEVWNGSEFSKTTVMKTGTDQDMVRIRFSNTMEIKCTPYHKFHLVSGSRNNTSIVVEATQLKEGDRLMKCEYPIIKTSTADDMLYPYTHGFFCGDGTYINNALNSPETSFCKFKAKESELYCGRHLMYNNANDTAAVHGGICQATCRDVLPMVALYGEKKKLAQFLEIRSTSGAEDAVGRINCQLPLNLSPKYTVPVNASLECRLQWLAGLADADGCVVRVSGNESIQISSTHLRMLQDVMLMLQTMGVNANIRTMQEAGPRQMPDGHGGLAEYQCNTTYRIFISNSDLIRLHALGFQTHRLSFKQENTPNREAKRFVKVVSVEPLLDQSDTYCFNEPKRHTGIFGGVITGNCSEIMQFTSSEEIAVCNLASINVAAFCQEDGSYDFSGLVQTAERVCFNLNGMIDKNLYPVPEAQYSNEQHRPIGIGQQGLANAFFKLKIAFESEEALRLSTAISEAIYYGAVHASIKLAKQHGPYPSYQGSPFSQGLFQFDLWLADQLPVQFCGRFDWEVLRRAMKQHGIRNSLLTAQMPTASTSQILNNTESVEPLSSNLYLRRTNAGEYVLLNRYLVEDLIAAGKWDAGIVNQLITSEGEGPKDSIYSTVWQLSQKTVIDQAASRGPFLDQSQSMNLFLAEPTVAKLSSMLFYGWQKGLKTGMYYLRTRAKAQPIKFVTEAKYDNSKKSSESGSSSSGPTCSLKSNAEDGGCSSCGA